MDNQPSAAEIGHRIRRAREALGLTQEQLAGRLRRPDGRTVSVGSLRTWEQGLYRPSIIGQLEEVLQVSLVAAPSTGTAAGPLLHEVGYKRLLAEADSRYSALEDQLAAALAEIQRLRGNDDTRRPDLRIAGPVVDDGSEPGEWAARHDADPEDPR